MTQTEKEKALLKWQPNEKYREEYDRIFGKTHINLTCFKCGTGELMPCQISSYPQKNYYTCKCCGYMSDSKIISTGDDFEIIKGK